jgi:hypothetical protein
MPRKVMILVIFSIVLVACSSGGSGYPIDADHPEYGNHPLYESWEVDDETLIRFSATTNEYDWTSTKDSGIVTFKDEYGWHSSAFSIVSDSELKIYRYSRDKTYSFNYKISGGKLTLESNDRYWPVSDSSKFYESFTWTLKK